jgi:hypothetical protein
LETLLLQRLAEKTGFFGARPFILAMETVISRIKTNYLEDINAGLPTSTTVYHAFLWSCDIHFVHVFAGIS